MLLQLQQHEQQSGHAHKPAKPMRASSLLSESSDGSSSSCELDSRMFRSLSPVSSLGSMGLHKPRGYRMFRMPALLVDYIDAWRIWYGGEFGFAVMDWTEALILREFVFHLWWADA
jgi:hypothetical protein